MSRRSWARCFTKSGLVWLVALGGAPSSASAGEPEELWRYRTTESIEFLDAAGESHLLVGTQKRIVSLALETGRVSWRREDVGKLHGQSLDVLPSRSYAAVRSSTRTGLGFGRKKRLVLLDAGTGRTVWDSAEHDALKVERYLELGETGYVLIYGETPSGRWSSIGVELATGKRAWRQDDLFRTYPREWSDRRDLVYELFTSVSVDEDVILYASEAGPIRLRARTGEVLWRTESMEWTEPRSLMRVSDGVTYVPSGKTVVALDSETGDLLWRSPGNVPDRIWMVFETEHGLIARGDSFLDLLDESDGTSRWKKPIVEMQHNAFSNEGDELVFVTDDHFGTIDLETGERANLTELDFFEDFAHRIRRLDDDRYALLSPQDIALLTRSGEVKYHRHYDAPGDGILGTIYHAMNSSFTDLDHEYEESGTTQGSHFVFTDEPTESRAGRSVVQIDLRTGEERARVWVEGKKTTILVDDDTRTLVVKSTDKELIAVRYPVLPDP